MDHRPDLRSWSGTWTGSRSSSRWSSPSRRCCFLCASTVRFRNDFIPSREYAEKDVWPDYVPWRARRCRRPRRSRPPRAVARSNSAAKTPARRLAARRQHRRRPQGGTSQSAPSRSPTASTGSDNAPARRGERGWPSSKRSRRPSASTSKRMAASRRYRAPCSRACRSSRRRRSRRSPTTSTRLRCGPTAFRSRAPTSSTPRPRRSRGPDIYDRTGYTGIDISHVPDAEDRRRHVREGQDLRELAAAFSGGVGILPSHLPCRARTATSC